MHDSFAVLEKISDSVILCTQLNYINIRIDTAAVLCYLIMCLPYIAVIYAYEQALLCLGYYPDMWYEAALFQQRAAAVLAEKGDVKLAATMNTDIIR